MLGRIARDLLLKNENLGPHLMFCALNRANLGSREIASVGFVLDPNNEALARYYEKYGFIRLQENLGFLSHVSPREGYRSDLETLKACSSLL